ncbi:twin transmembrane helix small protein [Gemmobacter caeruleus]|uniref:twin transmembrane helix small protein n=1 Tax=Gemmobacter caeruleus TaxID=2595004 RepID=UPI0011EE0D66|nr:twin transmembrane helix small protein [Gemmobacter caeruleus]
MLLQDPLFLLAALACLVVVIILTIGIGAFGKGGEFNRRHANRLMRYRIIGQAVAVILIVIFAWLRSKGGQ